VIHKPDFFRNLLSARDHFESTRCSGQRRLRGPPGCPPDLPELGHLTILNGGSVVYESAGQEQQKYGDDFPQWRRT
jgi:hypothetical protein